MSRLTYDERKRLPASAFALPKRRKFPIHDATHAADAMSRLSKSWNLGHLTESEYKTAHAAIRKAEERFGVHHHPGHAGSRRVVRPEERAMGGGGSHESGRRGPPVSLSRMRVRGYTILYPRGEATRIRAMINALDGVTGKVSAATLRSVLPGRAHRNMPLHDALALVGAYVIDATWG